MAQIKTVTTTSGTNSIKFDAHYPYVWFKNLGAGDVYVSDNSQAQAGVDDTALLKAGEIIRITAQTDTVYVVGATTVEIHAQGFADCPFKKRGKGGEIELTGINITENGTYTPPSGKAYGRVDVSVITPAVTVPLTVTENGTYNAPTGVDGYSPVTVNVPVGAEIITRSAWDAMTTTEKQSKGLVAIQDTNTGFNRGVLVNGADYQPVGVYLPASDDSTVICEAYYDNFDTDASWGAGNNPVQYMVPSSRPDKNTIEKAIYCPAATSGVVPYVDIGASTASFTAYVVMYMVSPTQYSRILSSVGQRQNNSGIMLYGSTVNVSSWGSDTPTTIPSTSFFVGAIKYGSSAAGYVFDGTDFVKVAKSPNQYGRYITIGRTDINANTQNAEPCDCFVRYIAVTNVTETDEVIETNMRSLYQTFVSQE